MSLDRSQFTDLIKRVITAQGLYSDQALAMLLGIAAHESYLGTYLRQKGGGPGRGIFQIEVPSTEIDIWANYLFYRQERRLTLTRISGVLSYKNSGAMEWNLAYQICMARLYLKRIPEPFPSSFDVVGQAKYWKIYWNTEKGLGSEQEFIQNHVKYIGG